LPARAVSLRAAALGPMRGESFKHADLQRATSRGAVTHSPHSQQHRNAAAAPARRAPLAARAAVKETTETAAAPSKDSAARQMLGMKGAALETDKFKIRVQLTKPVTWVPLIWGE
jgi:hypothetical protein